MKLKLALATIAALIMTVALPVSIKNTPYIPNRGDVAAIDNSGSDGQESAERKEFPNRPHPPRIVKLRFSNSIAAMSD